ncbi:MAG: hypothetical protein HY791_40290 [Deltaproteobacteria bacterium]|nr:hypothetical protein [Deltaproteobacteria bacterium]
MRKQRIHTLLIFLGALGVPLVLGRFAIRGTVDPPVPWSFRFLFPATLILAVLTAVTFALYTRARGFIVSYDRPVFPRLQIRNKVIVLWGSMVVMTVPLMPYVAYLIQELRALGLPIDAGLGRLVGSVLLVSLFHLVVYPTELVLRRALRLRMLTLGATEAELAEGHIVGIADPGLSAWGRSTPLDDVGLLLIRDEKLHFRGDSTSFVVPVGSMLSVARTERASTWTPALLGTVPLETRFTDDQGRERSLLVFPMSHWFLGIRREAHTLLARLSAWKRLLPASG